MRRSWLLLLCAALSLLGCEQQIRLGVEQTTSTIPTILEDNVVANLYRIYYNQFAVIAQVTLKESVSNAQNSYNYGVSPNIALRAIAITGLTATAANSLSENWQVDPINGSLDQRRLQILFGYTVRPAYSLWTYGNLLTEIVNTGTREPIVPVDPKKAETDRHKLQFLIKSYLPPLPDRTSGPIAILEDSECHPPMDYDIKLALSLKHVCFKGDAMYTGHEKADLLVLWSIAIPEFSAFLNQSGASKGGSLPLSVNANPAPR